MEVRWRSRREGSSTSTRGSSRNPTTQRPAACPESRAGWRAHLPGAGDVPADAGRLGEATIPGLAAASASLKEAQLVPQRQRVNREIRSSVFAWLDQNGYSYVPSQSNCFMLNAKRPAKEIIDAMATQNVHIGRSWPVWPTYVRITVGTKPEMDQFQTAFHKVMSGAVTASAGSSPRAAKRRLDGILRPA